MAKITLLMTASLDGYVTKPDGMAVGAMTEPPELKRWKLDRISRARAHVMGRKTYQGMASVWPSSKDAYAAPMNDIPKIVFSKSLKKADWPETTIVSGPLSEEIAALKRGRGQEVIVWGGASFAQALARADLIDEYALITQPVAYGGGKPLFLNLREKLEFRVIATTSFASGHTLQLMVPKTHRPG